MILCPHTHVSSSFRSSRSLSNQSRNIQPINTRHPASQPFRQTDRQTDIRQTTRTRCASASLDNRWTATFVRWIARSSFSLEALFLPLDKLRRRFPAARATRERAHQRVLEGLAEIAVEVRVDERVQGAVEVTYPEEDGHDRVWTVAGLAAQGRG